MPVATITIDNEARSIIKSGLRIYKIPKQYEQIALAFIDGLRTGSMQSTDNNPDGDNKAGSSELTELFG